MPTKQPNPIPAVPLRTPLLDAQGNVSRTWTLFFQKISPTGGTLITPNHGL